MQRKFHDKEMENIELGYTPNKLLELLEKKKWTLSIAESCSGGLLSHFITNIEGISKYFKGSIVCYSNEAKINLVKIEPSLLEKYGSVSKEITQKLAENVKAVFSSDIGIGITCYASVTEDLIALKGLSFIAISTPLKTLIWRKKYFIGTRIKVKVSVAKFALLQLIELLST
jgi:PncC family amidohydrolase